jgi:hypothetical protein
VTEKSQDYRSFFVLQKWKAEPFGDMKEMVRAAGLGSGQSEAQIFYLLRLNTFSVDMYSC